MSTLDGEEEQRAAEALKEVSMINASFLGLHRDGEADIHEQGRHIQSAVELLKSSLR